MRGPNAKTIVNRRLVEEMRSRRLADLTCPRVCQQHTEGPVSKCGKPAPYRHKLRPGASDGDEEIVALCEEHKCKKCWRAPTPTGSTEP